MFEPGAHSCTVWLQGIYVYAYKWRALLHRVFREITTDKAALQHQSPRAGARQHVWHVSQHRTTAWLPASRADPGGQQLAVHGSACCL